MASKDKSKSTTAREPGTSKAAGTPKKIAGTPKKIAGTPKKIESPKPAAAKADAAAPAKKNAASEKKKAGPARPALKARAAKPAAKPEPAAATPATKPPAAKAQAAKPLPAKAQAVPKPAPGARAPEPAQAAPAIDAMSILDKADVGKESPPRKPGLPPSAAQAIARATARDHPAPAPSDEAKPARPAEEAVKPQPRHAPEGPLPKEPKEPVGGIGAEGLPKPLVDDADVAAILKAEHPDPYSFLGMHEVGPKKVLQVRAFLPEASTVQVVGDDGKAVGSLEKVHDEGLFAGEISGRKQRFAYRLKVTTIRGEAMIDDPYRFGPVMSDKDVAALAKGGQTGAYKFLGAHPTEIEGVAGTSFALWAPAAAHVAVVGDFNAWDGRRHGMRRRGNSGVWEIFVPGVGPGAFYKYEIKGAPGTVPEIKADPLAFHSERAPGFASVVHDLKGFRWRDGTWMKARKKASVRGDPVSFYQVHLGSWRRKPEEGHRPLNYRELAEDLVAYVSDLGFTHIALMPLSEYTFDDTLGYLPSALYAPTSRYGTPDDLRYLVDACHRAGIGVVADWVPNYLSEEPHGLARFDGESLYEHPDGYHGRDPDWNMPVYDLGRPQVADYVLGNALYWIEEFHLDGLRIDGLAKMLYLDYGRGEGDWLPNKDGGNENLEALAFLGRLNQTVAGKHPGVMIMAEDSSLRQGVTKPAADGGLGFSLRWDTAWAYDTLRYLRRHPVHRKYYQYEITNPLLHVFDENFVIPLSHDHVSYGQGALPNKIMGDRWQRFATLRAWYGLMYGMPSRKLMFMGAEFIQDREWNSEISLDWHLLDDPLNRGVQALIRDFNKLYRDNPALHELDSDPRGFEWLDFQDEDNSVVAFIRWDKARDQHLVFVTHFTPVVLADYRIGVPGMGRYWELLNTDAEAYGGSNAGSMGGTTAEFEECHGQPHSIRATLPPYATVVFELRK